MQIRSVSVLGAGTMGAQIAAHFANAGVPVLLLDVTRDQARAGFEKSRALKPDPLFTGGTHTLVRTGGFDEDLPAIAGSDWIIEAIVERLDIKRALLARVEQHRARATRSSARTHRGSRLPRFRKAGRDEFRRRWLGTHFFNPPRYLHLLELIPTA